MSSHLVYGLIDPRSNELRYVGKSSKGMFRPYRHATADGRKGNTHNKAWLRQLWDDGNLVPSVLILCECPTEASSFSREVELIRRFRDLGFRLTNETCGGEGACGCVISEETRNRQSMAAKRRWKSEEYRSKVINALRGKTASPETRAKQSLAKKGKPRIFSAEHRAKIGMAFRGKPLSEAHKAKMSATRRANNARKREAQQKEKT